LAALALTRGALLPFAWVALLWYCWRCRTLVHGWLCALLAILGFGLVLAPWTMRNYRELHNPLPIADEAYFHLWVGNHPARAGQFPAATGGPWQGDTMVVGEKDIQKTTHEFGEDVLEEVRQHPADTLQRRLNAGLYFFFGQEYFTNQRLWREKAAGTDVPEWFRNSYPGALFGSLLALFLLAVVGWRWSFPWPQSGLLAVAVLWIPLPYLLGHAGALQGPRLPLDGVFLCYAAYTLVGLFTCCRGGLTRRA
ncbi:MAG: hypothetical protein JO112_11250, partial [Planctomycetes bacterium]|nr:hypothetical protein [Planctomycetota bacterium]